ncbi:sortase-associated OmpA-like protein PdsO [Thalassotalea litorea]|uniref:Sortase-associated OmpA-like protein PdsO n=1 Tax=Thalassotalea litorea TaxID=2020715 RepID=A0A5R9INI2_9GAMM|nr:sortase-associated OmpA-like protein PdsO [Thalassotalea litorea]TLU66832.1 sortase-associated OmpA-like protein PdsO [Thalassotalea litorea]
MTLNQFKTLTVGLFFAALMAQPLQANASSGKTMADELSKEQAIGISSGAVIGAIFGGPPGAFLAAVLGDMIAKNMMVHEELDEVKTQLVVTEQSYQRQLTSLQQQNHQQLIDAKHQHQQVLIDQAENFLMSLMFANGSSEVASQYQPQIVAMAALLKQNPDITINLSGYTDTLGSKDKNLALAEERVMAVKTMLLVNGVNEIQIQSEAIGEVRQGDSENAVPSSFDRRVVMQLTATQTEVAKN